MLDPEWNPDDPLARMKGETRKANQALHDYAFMGAGRSLAKLCDWYNGRGQGAGKARAKTGVGLSASSPPAQPPTKRLATLEAWSSRSRYDWQRRVGAWQDLQTEKDRAKWEGRRQEWRERAWETAVRLLDKATDMLKFPVQEVERDLLGRPTRIEPAGWTFNTPAQMVAIADKLARLAAEIQPPNHFDADKINIDLDKLTDEQIERIASGEHPVEVILDGYTKQNNTA